MKLKLIIALVLVVLALGCTNLKGDLDMIGDPQNNSGYDIINADLTKPENIAKLTLPVNDDHKIFISYEVTVYGFSECVGITPCEIESSYTYDCRDIAEHYWRYPSSYEYPFNWAYDKCNYTFPELIQAKIDKEENKHGTILVENWTVAPDDNIRSITWDYNYGGKEWKYFTMYGATCNEIDCIVADAYCLECEGIEQEIDYMGYLKD